MGETSCCVAPCGNAANVTIGVLASARRESVLNTMMKNRSDTWSFIGLVAAFGGQGVITGFQPQIQQLACGPFATTACGIEIEIIAVLKLLTGVAGIIAGYHLLRKTSTPPGTTLAVVPHDQVPVTAPKNGINGPSYSPITPGSSGEPLSVSPLKGIP